MKFTIKGPLKENIYTLMRKVGYCFQDKDEKKSEMIFVRPLQRSGYPRLHLYLKVENDDLILNLHLDQKRPVYKSTPAHSGEYEGKVVEEEVERIKKILQYGETVG